MLLEIVYMGSNASLPVRSGKALEAIMCTTKTQITDESVTIEDKMCRATKLMQQMRDFGSSGSINQRENLQLMQRRIKQIAMELEDIIDDLLNLVRSKIAPNQLRFLEEIKVDESDIDPSIQFFGVEWNGVFAKCFNLGLNIRIFKYGLSAECVDLLGLACILTDLKWVLKQMELHDVALTTGVLSPCHLALDLQQKLVLTKAEEENNKKRSIVVKYNRKHKTENLSTKLFGTDEKVRRRKSSFIENVSSLLNYVSNSK